jgi:hypothetical protein
MRLLKLSNIMHEMFHSEKKNGLNWSLRRLVTDLGLYSGAAWFEYRSGHQLTKLRRFVIVLISFKQMPGRDLRLSHDHFFLHNFQFFIHIKQFAAALPDLLEALLHEVQTKKKSEKFSERDLQPSKDITAFNNTEF